MSKNIGIWKEKFDTRLTHQGFIFPIVEYECPECGRQVDEIEKYCPSCGKDMKIEEAVDNDR